MTTDAFTPWNYRTLAEDVHVKWATPGQVCAVVAATQGSTTSTYTAAVGTAPVGREPPVLTLPR